MYNPLREYKDKSGVSVSRIAKAFRVPMPTLRRLIYYGTPEMYLKLRLGTMLKIQRGTGLDIIGWIERKGVEQHLL